ncbi:hypothetical protein QUC31_014644 [Theobroma cacao]
MTRKINHKERTTEASQLSLLTTKYKPAMNAMDIIVSATPRRGTASLRAKNTKPRSINCAQMSVTSMMMELYIAIVLQMTNSWNILSLSMIAEPSSGLELLSPPGIVKPAENVTVATSVETNNITLTFSL